MEHMIWNREMECADRETKNAIQLDRLKKTVEYCYNRVPFYKNKFDEMGLRPEHIKTLADVRHLPFTTAEDLKNMGIVEQVIPEREKLTEENFDSVQEILDREIRSFLDVYCEMPEEELLEKRYFRFRNM